MKVERPFRQALRASVHASGGPENGGLPVNEWAGAAKVAQVIHSGVVAVASAGKGGTRSR